jgi:hypothetical protein
MGLLGGSSALRPFTAGLELENGHEAPTARNTAFTFKGRAVNIPSILRTLNVSHVLEGSVRKVGGASGSTHR